MSTSKAILYDWYEACKTFTNIRNSSFVFKEGNFSKGTEEAQPIFSG